MADLFERYEAPRPRVDLFERYALKDGGAGAEVSRTSAAADNGPPLPPLTQAAPGAGEGGLTIDMTKRSGSGEEPAPKRDVPSYYRPAIGANKGIASTLGAPVDAATFLINNAPGTLLVNKGAELLGYEPPIPKIKNPIGGSESIKQAMGVVGANPDQFTPPATTEDKLLEAAGEGAASMVIPAAGFAAPAKVAMTPQSLGVTLGEILGAQTIDDSIISFIRGVGSNLAVGAASGAAGEAAEEAAPEALKPTARAVGGLAGGAGAALVDSAANAAWNATKRAVRSIVEPVEAAAARTILSRADNPAALRRRVAEVAEAPPLVEGSQPTTFQATGDLGVGALEREVATSPKGVPRFAERRQEQNAARTAALERVGEPPVPVSEPATGATPARVEADPAAVGATVQQRIKELRDSHDAKVAAARADLDARFRAGQMSDAEYGAGLREAPLRVRAQLEAAEDDLWRAVDPDKVAPFNPVPLKAGVEAIEASIPRTAKPPEGEERALFDVIKSLDETTTFGDITALRSRLTDELRDQTGSPTVRRRITLMLKEVDSALADTAEQSPEVLQRYAAARAATREKAERMGEGAVGRVLRPGANEGFQVTASNVAKNIFDRPEDLRAYLNAIADDEAGRALLRDYAAFSLRKDAMRDGLISPQKLQKWTDDHAYVLDAFPDLRAQFADVKKAQGAVDEAIAAQAAALEKHQSQSLNRLLNGQDIAQVVPRLVSNPDEMAQIVGLVKDNPAAVAGLKRAVAEFMMTKAKGTAEAGTSGIEQINAATLQKFFINNRRALATVFDEAEMRTLANIAADLQRANRSIVAVKNPGGSNTAQDTSSRFASVVRDLWRAHAGKGAGMALDPSGGAIGLAAGAAVDAMRAARMDRIDKAIVEMMLDPKMAAAWLSKAPLKTEADGRSFAARLRAVAANRIMDAAANVSAADDSREAEGAH